MSSNQAIISQNLKPYNTLTPLTIVFMFILVLNAIILYLTINRIDIDSMAVVSRGSGSYAEFKPLSGWFISIPIIDKVKRVKIMNKKNFCKPLQTSDGRELKVKFSIEWKVDEIKCGWFVEKMGSWKVAEGFIENYFDRQFRDISMTVMEVMDKRDDFDTRCCQGLLTAVKELNLRHDCRDIIQFTSIELMGIDYPAIPKTTGIKKINDVLVNLNIENKTNLSNIYAQKARREFDRPTTICMKKDKTYSKALVGKIEVEGHGNEFEKLLQLETP